MEQNCRVIAAYRRVPKCRTRIESEIPFTTRRISLRVPIAQSPPYAAICQIAEIVLFPMAG